MEFVGEVREEVKKMGYSASEYFFRVRPEKRENRTQIKVEVRRKGEGGRFSLKGVWACPPPP
jgi:hypothetical protein